MTNDHFILLRYIHTFFQAHGYAPTDQELGELMGLSRMAINIRIHLMIKWGWIARDERRHRSLEITDLGEQILKERERT